MGKKSKKNKRRSSNQEVAAAVPKSGPTDAAAGYACAGQSHSGLKFEKNPAALVACTELTGFIMRIIACNDNDGAHDTRKEEAEALIGNFLVHLENALDDVARLRANLERERQRDAVLHKNCTDVSGEDGSTSQSLAVDIKEPKEISVTALLQAAEHEDQKVPVEVLAQVALQSKMDTNLLEALILSKDEEIATLNNKIALLQEQLPTSEHIKEIEEKNKIQAKVIKSPRDEGKDDSLNQPSDRLKTKSDEKIRKLLSKNIKLNQSLVASETEVELLADELAGLLKNKDDHIETQAKLREVMDHQLSSANATILGFEEDLKKIKEELEEGKKREKEQSSCLKKLKSENTHFDELLDKVRKELSSLQAKYSESEQYNARLEKGKSELTKKNSDLQYDVHEVYSANQILTAKLLDIRPKYKALEEAFCDYRLAAGPVRYHFADAFCQLHQLFQASETVSRVEFYVKGYVQSFFRSGITSHSRLHQDIDLYVALFDQGNKQITDWNIQKEYIQKLCPILRTNQPSGFSLVNITYDKNEKFANFTISSGDWNFDFSIYPEKVSQVVDKSCVYTQGAGLTPISFSNGGYSCESGIYTEDFKAYVFSTDLWNDFPKGRVYIDHEKLFLSFMSKNADNLPFDYTGSDEPKVTPVDLKFLLKNCIRCIVEGLAVSERMKSLVIKLIDAVPAGSEYTLLQYYQFIHRSYRDRLISNLGNVDNVRKHWLIKALADKYPSFSSCIEASCNKIFPSPQAAASPSVFFNPFSPNDAVVSKCPSVE